MEVKKMEQVLNTILSELKEMRSDIHDLKRGQQSFHEELKVLTNDVTILKDNVTTLKVDVTTLKDNITALTSGQTRIVSLISDIPKQFDQLENSIGLDLERHQRILDLLSTKSIEHEADIKHMKSMIQNQ